MQPSLVGTRAWSKTEASAVAAGVVARQSDN